MTKTEPIKINFEYVLEIKETFFNENYVIEKNNFQLPLALIDCMLNSRDKESDLANYKQASLDEFSTYNHLSRDFLITLIDGLKLLITGSIPNSCSLARIALETVGLIEYAIAFNSFQEIRRKYVFASENHGLPFNKAQRALILLDENNNKSKRKSMWDYLSSFASHASQERMQYNHQVWDNEIVPTLGYRLSSKKPLPKGLIDIFNTLSAYFINVTIGFYDNKQFYKVKDFQQLKEDYKDAF